jgi:uncharacterized protein (TIGR02246 family)
MLPTILLTSLLLAANATAPGAALASAQQEAAPTPAAEQVVRRYMAAYNQQDVRAVLAFLADEITWFSIQGDSVSVQARGKAAFESFLGKYFANNPTSRSEVEQAQVLGPFVSIVERATWKAKSGEQTQAALAVYEVQEGKIRRVWYYAAVR